ncbi:MAG TPA: pyridoxamine 5'-phosphate oxidase [Oceanospirillales bacterium]|nr:pyridoxamine 5'-phosphate oxidase [Oceanospirillales bacterium]
MDITTLRKDYTQAGLNRNDLHNSPFQQFDTWFQQAQQAGIEEPNAMGISTVSDAGIPSSRTVLLKIYDDRGFVFFTNYNSHKARDINNNPQVALLFTWLGLERQVRINGHAEKISSKESFAYFTSRPRGSQIGAWISPQSQMIESRDFLKLKLAEMKAKFSSGKIPLPNAWGGYRIIPEKFEFWQGRSSRLHDRFVYEKNRNNWHIKRLAP